MHVHIVHGYGASPSDHWFPWLKRELEKTGATVSIIDLPSPDDPEPEAWQRALAAQLPVLDGNTWFVAHSLGGIALLRYLESAAGTSAIGGYVLVSGFNGHLAVLPQLDGFAQPGIDYQRLSHIARNRVVIASEDDTIVPQALSRALAGSLDARFVPVERSGHFLDSDGFTEFPLVRDVLAEAVRSGR